MADDEVQHESTAEEGKGNGRNGWKAGTDPTVRTLRVVAAIVLIITIPAAVVLDRDPLLAGSIIVGLLALLGIVEAGARFPDWRGK